MATILVVEDEQDLCNLIRTQLEAEGYTVHQAFDGPSALELVERAALRRGVAGGVRRAGLVLAGADGGQAHEPAR